MKESEFLELLNLYLDHEISPADAIRLEQEVLTNGGRRAVYHAYCRMQKACRLVAADFQTESAQTGEIARGKVVAFEAVPARRKSRVGYYLAGSLAAAAAGIALVFVFLSKPRKPAEATALASSAPAGQAAVPIGATPVGRETFVAESVTPRGLVSVASLQPPREQPTVMLAANSLVLSGNQQAQGTLATAGQQPDDQLAWIRNFQLVSLQERTQIEQLRFESVPASLRPEGRQLGGRPPTEAAVEMNAFRFLK